MRCCDSKITIRTLTFAKPLAQLTWGTRGVLGGSAKEGPSIADYGARSSHGRWLRRGCRTAVGMSHLSPEDLTNATHQMTDAARQKSWTKSVLQVLRVARRAGKPLACCCIRAQVDRYAYFNALDTERSDLRRLQGFGFWSYMLSPAVAAAAMALPIRCNTSRADVPISCHTSNTPLVNRLIRRMQACLQPSSARTTK